MKWIIDFLIGTIESIEAFSPGEICHSQYFIIKFEEYEKINFKIFFNTAIKYGIYDESGQHGFNRKKFELFKGRRAEVKVRQEKPEKKDWYIIDELNWLNKT